MSRISPYRKTLKIKIEKTSELTRTDSSPTSALIITKPEISQTKRRTTKSPVPDSPKPINSLVPESISIISLKNIENLPLTEVTSLVPNEIPPNQVEKSENPSVNYFFERAFEASRNREFQKSVTLYKKVLACEANHFETCINIGVCLMQLSMHIDAIASFDSAIKSNKSSFVPYYNKALSFIATQNYPAALQCMDTANTLFDSPPEELQKIRTFAIFKSGKVSSAISNGERESPNTKMQFRTFSPVEEVIEKQERVLRRLTMQPETQMRKLVEHEPPHRKLTIVQDFDTRNIKTAIGVMERSEKSSVSKSPDRVSKSKQSSYVYDWKKYIPQEFFVPQASVKMKISELEAVSVQSKDPLVLKKVREKLRTLEDKLIEYIAKRVQKCFLEPRCISKYQLTEREVEILTQLFASKDFEGIDKICKFLEFFVDMPVEYRERVYKVAKIEKFEKGTKLFVQGNAATKFFLVMKGKVASVVDSEKSEINSTTDYLRFVRSMTSDKKYYVSLENLANCVAEEVSYTMSFSTFEYQMIFCDLLKQNIEDRVCFLINLPLFKGVDPMYLIPLAWHLNAEKYSEGQTIQQKYEVPKGLTIIYSGYCGIYTAGYQIRNKIGSEFANIKKRKPKPASFYVGNLKSPIKPAAKTYFSSAKDTLSETNYKTIEKIEHGLLRYGDYFGGRVLLDQKYADLTSKYSIIAESKAVEVFVISKQSMQNLQEKLVLHLRTVIQKAHDVDCPPDVDGEVMDLEFREWQKFKVNVIDDIQRKKFVDSKKIEFPYLR